MLEKIFNDGTGVRFLELGSDRFNVTLDGVVRRRENDRYVVVTTDDVIVNIDHISYRINLVNIIQMAWKPVIAEDLLFYATVAEVLYRDKDVSNRSPVNLIWRFDTRYDERFRRIPGFSRYLVDNMYRIYDRLTGKYLNPHFVKRDYVTVSVVADSNPKYARSRILHRLIAMAFHPYGEDLIELTVNHKDGDKYNYTHTNLEFCTYRDNNLHAVRTGLSKTNNRILVIDTVLGTENIYMSQGECSRQMGIDKRLLAWRLNQGANKVYDGKYIFKRLDQRRDVKYATCSRVTLVYDKVTGEVNEYSSLAKAAPYIGIAYAALKKRAARNALEFPRYSVKTYNPLLGEEKPTF